MPSTTRVSNPARGKEEEGEVGAKAFAPSSSTEFFGRLEERGAEPEAADWGKICAFGFGAAFALDFPLPLPPKRDFSGSMKSSGG